ncbi:MAG: PAS domain S-box protein [Pseudomonadota bacterium]
MNSDQILSRKNLEAERFRLFVAGVSDYAIYMLSTEGIVDSWNAGAQRFKGYVPDEIIGRHFSLFYTEEDRLTDLPATALQTAINEGKFEDEGWRVRKDGSRFWASVVIDAIHDEQGKLIGFAKVTRDITERKKAQEALHASEEQFRLLVQGVRDYAIYMLSPEGMVTNWNAGGRRIKGFEAGEVVGTHFSRFYSEEDQLNGMPRKALDIATREGRFESEGWRVRKDGTQFWAHVVIDPIKNQLGDLIGFAKVTRDITERRQTSLELEKAKEALFQSQKLESIGKLTGGVAHDFNNILNVIVTGIDLLAKEIQTPGGVKILASMQRSATQGGKLTQQLLTFGRQQPLKQERHNINRVIRSFEAVLRRANTVGVEFVIDLEPDLTPTMIDATQFEAALLNLIVNAGDAMPNGGCITVSTSMATLITNQVPSVPAGRYVKVSVKDTGTGMSAEIVSRAVEPFFTTKGIGKGTGLGLSQVYGAVHQCGGTLLIDSTVGQGTTINMYFPALQNDATQDAALFYEDAGNEKALIVDDQPDVLSLASELFHDLGYDVLTANSGEDALDILNRVPNIDVLLPISSCPA